MIITKAPLRVSLFGGGTDLPKYFGDEDTGYGEVLSGTISMDIAVVVNMNRGDKYRIVYSQIEEVNKIDDIRHDRAREILRHYGILPGIEISSFSPITTRGSGLGSSSAYTVALLKAICPRVTNHELAALACHIEIDKCGDPIGLQDQYASAFGGMNRIRFFGNGRVEVSPVMLDYSTLISLNMNMFLVNTETERSTAQILANIPKTDSGHDSWIKTMNEIKSLVTPGIDALEKMNIDLIGPMLDHAWRLKRNMVKGVTDSKLDEMYQAGIDSGATGGKLLGAGGGGYFLFYVPQKNQHKWYNNIGKSSQVMSVGFCNNAARVIYNDEYPL